ncbi:SDR family NAD(P)-dependent oxidoreductase [Mycolicibacterium hodleri]|uniref:SDR family NAD(P)-dependent oxidoreductase n=1 Tax=Mycolicibacterium hodleri TaxID=49897 RepID=UPI001960B939|nr:SDR family oxidoreductase [Mycolicibacterium hodleri]
MTGKIAVTGGGQGLGAALAKRFADDGARVVVLDLNAETVRSVAAAIGGRAFTCDVGVREQLDSAIDTIEDVIGPIDLFCSNAAIFGGDGSSGLAETPDALWESAININLMSHIWAATKLVPLMEGRGGGYFLQVLSAAGLITGPSPLSYTVTKHAGIGFAEWLSINHRHNGIGVSCLCPTAVATPQLALPAANEEDERIRAQVGLIQTPEEVADITIRGLAEETFLILPNERLGTSFLHKAQDYDRCLDHTARRVTAMRVM